MYLCKHLFIGMVNFLALAHTHTHTLVVQRYALHPLSLSLSLSLSLKRTCSLRAQNVPVFFDQRHQIIFEGLNARRDRWIDPGRFIKHPALCPRTSRPDYVRACTHMLATISRSISSTVGLVSGFCYLTTSLFFPVPLVSLFPFCIDASPSAGGIYIIDRPQAAKHFLILR